MSAESPPRWFNAHGFKMGLSPQNLEAVPCRTPSVTVSTKVAGLQIHLIESEMYWVYWFLVHSTGQIEGNIKMSRAEVRVAFGLAAQTEDRTFAKKFNADAASPGRFIRRGSYLNLPMPGTGVDGDPNISVYISPEIRLAIQALLAE